MTALNFANLINLVPVSTIAGSEFAVSFFVHLELRGLPQPFHIASVQIRS